MKKTINSRIQLRDLKKLKINRVLTKNKKEK
jgi:hypothetical protein